MAAQGFLLNRHVFTGVNGAGASFRQRAGLINEHSSSGTAGVERISFVYLASLTMR